MNTEDAKGRAKEAAGDLTGDRDLQKEGKADQASAGIKEKITSGIDKVKDAITKD